MAYKLNENLIKTTSLVKQMLHEFVAGEGQSRKLGM